MPTRNLGKTGFRVGIFGLGGQGSLEKASNESLALQMIQRALELGVNHLILPPFTAGLTEGVNVILERVLIKGCRDHVFIATETRERTRDAALKNLDVSLKLLDTDYIDRC
jgi:predicted aldo/keto reductase-like oxidoreductase